MEILAIYTVLLFGLFLMAVGALMLIDPSRARNLLRKAGSTNLINYGEITVRMIPAAALIISSPVSKYPDGFYVLGWFMIATSLVLYFVPRKWHHQYALKSSEILTPRLIRIISPLAVFFGYVVIDAVIGAL